jgi:hypothetical protein
MRGVGARFGGVLVEGGEEGAEEGGGLGVVEEGCGVWRGCAALGGFGEVVREFHAGKAAGDAVDEVAGFAGAGTEPVADEGAFVVAGDRDLALFGGVGVDHGGQGFDAALEGTDGRGLGAFGGGGADLGEALGGVGG